MSLVITSIARRRACEMVELARRMLAAGADLVELRLDALAADEVVGLLSNAGSLPAGNWIATCRSRAEGGACDRSRAERTALLDAAVGAGAAFVDVELGEFEGMEAGSALAEAATLIVSHHDLAGRPASSDQRVARMSSIALGHDAPTANVVAKLAWCCERVTDNFEAFELMRGAPGLRIIIAMGEKGLASRVLARKFGAFGTFCAPTSADATAPGQVSLREMIEQYRWRQQTENTRVLGVLGCPVAHSLSPAIFNAQFSAADFDGVYLPILVETDTELRAFLDGCVARPWLDALGFSVTVPHKRSALAWAGDAVEPLARRIGAVNTLHFTRGGVRAYNTDYAGALAAITGGLEISEVELAKLPVAVLGAGGVARAVVAGLHDRGATVTIYNRMDRRAQDLAAEFDCHAAKWEDRHRHSAKVIVNCTKVGMYPDVAASPMPRDGLRRDVAVFDTVYNPRETQLLGQAREEGCVTVDGVAMFVQQAAAQYRIWTSAEPDVSLFERIVTDRLA